MKKKAPPSVVRDLGGVFREGLTPLSCVHGPLFMDPSFPWSVIRSAVLVQQGLDGLDELAVCEARDETPAA